MDRCAKKIKDELNPERLQRLDDILCLGSIWFSVGVGFSTQRFYDREGHCLVPIKHKEMDLRQWVGSQRQNKQRRSLEQLTVRDIGFVWDVKEHQWERLYNT